ncbi:MAG: hypothetical protein AAFX87_26400 [Bacteroidota bacterium]
MQKPSSVKWIYGILIFQIALVVLVIAIAAYALESNSGNPFLQGFKEALFDDADTTGSNNAFLIGLLIGNFIFPIIAIILQLVFLHYRKYTGLLVVVILHLIYGLLQFSLPLFQIVMLILVVNEKTKSYLKGEDPKVDLDTLDSDL